PERLADMQRALACGAVALGTGDATTREAIWRELLAAQTGSADPGIAESIPGWAARLSLYRLGPEQIDEVLQAAEMRVVTNRWLEIERAAGHSAAERLDQLAVRTPPPPVTLEQGLSDPLRSQVERLRARMQNMPWTGLGLVWLDPQGGDIGAAAAMLGRALG